MSLQEYLLQEFVYKMPAFQLSNMLRFSTVHTIQIS